MYAIRSYYVQFTPGIGGRDIAVVGIAWEHPDDVAQPVFIRDGRGLEMRSQLVLIALKIKKPQLPFPGNPAICSP